MFDQLTWSLGMFAQSTCVLFAVGYCLRNTALANTWNNLSDTANVTNWRYQIVWATSGLVLTYALQLGFLHWVYGGQDSTALDWAVVVLLLGGLVVHPLATAVATLVSAVIRVSLVFSYSVDPETRASFDSHGRWLLDSRFWFEERWVWGDPGVYLLLTCAVLAAIFHVYWRIHRKHDYPLWIGIPIALISQSAYVWAANDQWGRSSAVLYLQNEAVPAAISLAVVTTALVVLLRSITATREQRRRIDAELAATQDKLKFLNAQINPHFLNNSLNAVAALSTTNPESTREMIGKLALHYRARCDISSSLIKFSDEWKLALCYIDIEKIRMGSRLRVEISIEPACHEIQLPRLVIQPLIENAIQHGIQDRSDNGLLKITARLRDDQLVVTVQDNGPGQMKKLTSNDFGTGLRNVSSRLAHFYGDAASMHIESCWGSGTTATLSIPAMVEETA